MHRISRKIINCALDFVNSPRGETVSKPPLNIVIQNGRGRFGSTVNGNEDIIFVVENLNRYRCDCLGAHVQISGRRTVLKTWEATIEENQFRYRPPPESHRVDINVNCGTQDAHKAVSLVYEPPTFDSIEVTPSTRRERSMVLFADGVRDDGWNPSDYQVHVTLDGTQDYSDSGTGITLNNLSSGRHSATMRIRDGFGRWSGPKSTYFTIPEQPPSVAFVNPPEGFRVHRGSNLPIAVIVGSSAGIMRLSIYLDRESEDEFNPTNLCYFPGYPESFGADRPTLKTCSAAISTPGTHVLIAVAIDNSGQTNRARRIIQVE
jgi:hypothetical protein